MTLLRLKTAPILLIEDDINKNIIPLLLELTPTDKLKTMFFCYEQPASVWKNIFKGQPNVTFHEEYEAELFDKYVNEKCCVVIDSINQMSLCMGWSNCLKNLKILSSHSNVNKLIIVLHRDCLSTLSKLRIQLNHFASAVVSYDQSLASQIKVHLKKGGKLITSIETLSFDSKTSTLKSTPKAKDNNMENEPEKPSPGNLSTFKIEVDQTEKLEKYKLKLPYMSKIHEGEGKIFYEPDAVDDWDEEDPDEDLDI